jgi:ABC-type sugar transport system ATPase subunit
LVEDLKAILIQSKQTAIYVTHDQEEAFTIANRVVLMNRGKVVQFDEPHKIYNFPGSVFVAKFLGLSNLLPAELGSDGNRYYLSTPIGQIPLLEPIQGKVTVLIRPDAIYLDSDKSHKFAGIVTETSFLGNKSRVNFDVNGHTLTFDLPSSFRLPTKGELIHLSYDPHKAIQVFSDLKLNFTTMS